MGKLLLLWLLFLVLQAVSITEGFVSLGFKTRYSTMAKCPGNVFGCRVRNTHMFLTPQQKPQQTRESKDASDTFAVTQVSGPLTPHVLADYWGTKPLLIRNAFDAEELQSQGIWPTWNDIVDLACVYPEEDEVCSGESARRIIHIPNQLDSYAVELGPFEPEELVVDGSDDNDDKDERWTLLVNDVDRYLPPLAYWMDREFDFLPRWRRDDAQVSIAPVGGGIGSHVDNYDVFLAQASGQRAWWLQSPITVQQEMDSLIPNLSVRILNVTAPNPTTNEMDQQGAHVLHLNPGDVLYLPPRIVHWGTSLTPDCMTLSVGCRAPSASDLMARVAEEMATSVSPEATARYEDANLIRKLLDHDDATNNNNDKTCSSMGPSLSTKVKNDMKQLVLEAVEALLNDEDKWDEIVGSVVTEPNRFLDGAICPYDEITDDDFLDKWGKTPAEALDRIVTKGRGCLRRTEGVSFATSQVVKDTRDLDNENDTTQNGDEIKWHRVYGYGQMWQIPGNQIGTEYVLAAIEQGHALYKQDLGNASEEVMSMLQEMMAEGLLYPSSDRF